MKNISDFSEVFFTPMEENMELFNSEFDVELCKVGEKSELFDSSYDDDLYNLCAMVETQLNQPLQLGRGIKRTSNEEPRTVIKKPRTEEEEASTSAGTSGGNEGQVESLARQALNETRVLRIIAWIKYCQTCQCLGYITRYQH